MTASLDCCSEQLTSTASSTLTQREQDALQLLAEGRDQKEIAGRLSISTNTLGTHLAHIFTKLGVRSRAQAVALAYRDDLLHKGPLHCSALTALLLHGADSSTDVDHARIPLSHRANRYTSAGRSAHLIFRGPPRKRSRVRLTRTSK